MTDTEEAIIKREKTINNREKRPLLTERILLLTEKTIIKREKRPLLTERILLTETIINRENTIIDRDHYSQREYYY